MNRPIQASPVSPVVRAPHGTQLSCKGWHQEAALRMLMNNLDPDVAERPQDLVVYGGTGRAARTAREGPGVQTSKLAPQATSPIPAIRASISPRGISFSRSTKAVSPAIQ